MKYCKPSHKKLKSKWTKYWFFASLTALFTPDPRPMRLLYRVIIILGCFLPSNMQAFGWQTIEKLFKPASINYKLLYKTETKYFNIEVREERDGLRRLIFLPYHGSQSTWSVKQPRKIFSPSLKTLCTTLVVHATPPRSYLFLGMGAGIMPRFISRHFPNTKIDIVELDPAIPKIAQKYFGYKKSPNTRIIIADARVFINHCATRYDAIIIDVYNAKAVPFAVTTQEFFSKIKRCLTPRGVVGVNLANLGNRKFLHNELFTINQVFPRLRIYVCPDESNFIPIMSKQPLPPEKLLLQRAAKLTGTKKLEFPLAQWLRSCDIVNQLDNYFVGHPRFLTDDFAM